MIRLLNVEHHYLKEFEDDSPLALPRYIIASHRWADNEQTYCSFNMVGLCNHKIYKKLRGFCEAVREYREDIEWLWMDSCCIDGRDRKEVDYAINNMFQWYKNAETCFAYLWDVPGFGDMGKSNWFTRGWTLQELVAPELVVFFSQDWKKPPLGHKCPSKGWCNHTRYESNLNDSLARITGIRQHVLMDFDHIDEVPASEIIGWMKKRQTKRKEDIWYSLLGIFGVCMPLEYGEGKHNAWLRFARAVLEMQNRSKGPIGKGSNVQCHDRSSALVQKSMQVSSYESTAANITPRSITVCRDISTQGVPATKPTQVIDGYRGSMQIYPTASDTVNVRPSSLNPFQVSAQMSSDPKNVASRPGCETARYTGLVQAGSDSGTSARSGPQHTMTRYQQPRDNLQSAQRSATTPTTGTPPSKDPSSVYNRQLGWLSTRPYEMRATPTESQGQSQSYPYVATASSYATSSASRAYQYPAPVQVQSRSAGSVPQAFRQPPPTFQHSSNSRSINQYSEEDSSDTGGDESEEKYSNDSDGDESEEKDDSD